MKADNLIFKNDFYELALNSNGRLLINDVEGNSVVSEVSHYLVIVPSDVSGHDDTEKVPCEDPKITVEALPNGSRINMVCEGIFEVVHITLLVAEDTPAIHFRVRSTYKRDVEISREAIVLQFDIGVSEVVTRNRKRVRHDLEDRYWLAHQGAVFGEKSRSAFIYNVPKVSSLEVETVKNQLVVNLDYSKDHPYINRDPDGVWKDCSNSRYRRGDTRNNEFTLHVGFVPHFSPRVMRNPYGFLSTYIWTEHACNSDLRMQKAVYFGSESIDSHEKATGGFIKHGIPVTKSVFYTNRERVAMHKSESFTGEMLSIESEPDFLEFLKQLQSAGNYEVCLHCPQPATSPPELVEEAVHFMKNHFDTASWIDHLVFKYKRIWGNEERFSCDGLNDKKRNYVAPIWEKYDTKYFWNHALEYIDRIPKVRDRGMRRLTKSAWKKSIMPQLRRYVRSVLTKLRMLQHTRNIIKSATSLRQTEQNFDALLVGTTENFRSPEGVPNPIYWKHPTLTGDFYSWGTFLTRSYYFGKDDIAVERKNRLGDLADSWGLFIHHAYPARADDKNGCWEIDADGKVIVSKEFDEYLACVSSAHLGQLMGN